MDLREGHDPTWHRSEPIAHDELVKELREAAGVNDTNARPATVPEPLGRIRGSTPTRRGK
jgi:hypothetical protein